MSRITKYLIGAFLTALVVAPFGVLFAATTEATPSQHSLTVRYSDLSLDRAGDVATLYRRIGAAAQQVCGPRELTGSHFELPAYHACFTAAVSDAVASVASPALSAYYREHVPASQHASALAQR